MCSTHNFNECTRQFSSLIEPERCFRVSILLIAKVQRRDSNVHNHILISVCLPPVRFLFYNLSYNFFLPDVFPHNIFLNVW